MSGETARTRSTKSVTVFAPCTVAVGLFGLLKKTRPAPLRRGDHRLEVEPERRIDLDLGDRHVRASRVARAVLERRRAGRRAPASAMMNARIALFRISCEPAPRTMFSGLTLNFAAIAATSVAVVRRAVERIAARLGELAENRVERRLAGPERILVAADADFVDARRHERRAAAAPAPLGQMRLQPARGDERAGKRNGSAP